MEHAADTAALLQDGERVVGRFAGVDDDGPIQLPRERELRREDLLLHVARREVVVIVEADLADAAGAEASGMRTGRVGRRSRTLGEVSRRVRMDAGGEPDVRPFLADGLGPRCFLLVARGQDAQGRCQPGIPSRER
jgi:hypothetical protein